MPFTVACYKNVFVKEISHCTVAQNPETAGDVEERKRSVSLQYMVHRAERGT